jgi:exopolyphosphatase/guanosine-5'-triphosphate,3'-diphosphate pyrophosphatase
MILAGIDIGTNTIRLLVVQAGDTPHRELHSGMTITRLGQDLDRTGALSPDAQERSLAALKECAEIIQRHHVDHTTAVGTSALRQAANAAAFIAEAKSRVGIDIRVISAEEEARLTLLGVRRALARGDSGDDGPLASALVIDIGGGSTELVITHKGAVRSMASLPLGAVYLTERVLRHVPPDSEELQRLRAAVRTKLDGWERVALRSERDRRGSVLTCAGTAGTITTLASMDLELRTYDPARINGHILLKTRLDEMVSTLSRATRKQRSGIAGLERGREDIILAGAVIAQEIMERCCATEMLVSDWGLREGIVFDLQEKLGTDKRD